MVFRYSFADWPFAHYMPFHWTTLAGVHKFTSPRGVKEAVTGKNEIYQTHHYHQTHHDHGLVQLALLSLVSLSKKMATPEEDSIRKARNINKFISFRDSTPIISTVIAPDVQNILTYLVFIFIVNIFWTWHFGACCLPPLWWQPQSRCSRQQLPCYIPDVDCSADMDFRPWPARFYLWIVCITCTLGTGVLQ